MKYFRPTVVISLILIIGGVLDLKLFERGFFDPIKVWAKIPSSVGNKAAPIPVLKVENVVINDKKDISANQVKRSISSSVGGYGVSPKYNLVEYRMQWKVSVEDGSLAPVTAEVFVPLGSDANQRFPVVVYGAGTTGLADRCAPSREDLSRGNMGDYRNYMISEASQGYIVIMPNYEGFDNPNRTQHYFNKDNEARSMLSAGKALVTNASANSIPVQPGALFFGGYSQGGHAAFSAADYADVYMPDVKVAGVFGHGPTTNIAEYLKTNPNLAAYFFASYSEYYPAAIDPKVILTTKWIGLLDKARKICVDEGFGINSTTLTDVFADPFYKALINNTLAKDFPEVNKVFEENNAGTNYVTIPTMIVQGTTDPVVTDKVQGKFVDQLCRRGVSVDLKEYKGVHHFYTRQVSFHDTNDWIDEVSAGKPVTNSCTSR